MKILIVFYSYSGNNEKLALYLKEKLKCSILKISERKKRKTISILFDFCFKRSTELSYSDINLIDYDLTVFISPVWGSKIATPLRMFIDKEKGNINKYAFISFCNGEKDQKNKLISELFSLFEKDPILCLELSINKLLPEEKQNKIKHSFNFRITDEELKCFDDEIEVFIKRINNSGDII